MEGIPSAPYQQHRQTKPEVAAASKEKSGSLPNYSRLNGGALTARNALYVAEFPSDASKGATGSTNFSGGKEKNRRSFNFFWKSSPSGGAATGTGASTGSESSSSSSPSVSGSPPVAETSKSPRVKPSSGGRGLLGQLAKRCSQRRAPASDMRNGGKARDGGSVQRRNGEAEQPKSTNVAPSNGGHLQQHVYEEIRADGGAPRGRRGTRQGLTAKLDSLFAACARTPGGLRDGSLDNLSAGNGSSGGSGSRKQRKLAAKKRVEEQRRAVSSSSSGSDDDHGGFRSYRKFRSEEALNLATSKEKRIRLGRTERYYKRKAKDDETNGKHESDRPPRGGSRDRSAGRPADPTAVRPVVAHPSPAPAATGRPGDRQPATHDTVLRCQLPIGRAVTTVGASAAVARAPTPPPRSAKYANFGSPSTPPPTVDGRILPTGSQGQRPQSFSFETFHVGRSASSDRATWHRPTGAGKEPDVLPDQSSWRLPVPPPSGHQYQQRQSRSGRPMSFTATSSVTYHHAAPVQFQQVPGRPDPRRLSPASDSQLSSRHASNGPSRRASSLLDGGGSAEDSDSFQQYQQHHDQHQHNFNTIPKPWNNLLSPVPSGDGQQVWQQQGGGQGMVSRPPPSPTIRQPESFSPGLLRVPASSSLSSGSRSSKDPSDRSNPAVRLRDPASTGSSSAGSSLLAAPTPPTRKHYRQTASHSTNLEAAVGERLDRVLLQQRRRGAGAPSTSATSSSSGGSKRPTDNLEDALQELEKIYQSMKIDDDAADDPTTRRRNSTAGDLASWSRRSDEDATTTHPRLTKTSSKGSFDSLVAATDVEAAGAKRRTAAGVPDKVTDDLAYRKLAASAATTGRPVSTHLAGVTGSYLLLSPALSPSVSVDDLRGGAGEPGQPDTVLDDLSFRVYRDANLDHQRIADPQPPFGIPVGPVSQAASSDYLHARAGDLSRPKMRRRFAPDVVKDDLAYRNLRREQRRERGGGSEQVASTTAPTPPPPSPSPAVVPVPVPASVTNLESLNFDELDSIIRCGLPEAEIEAAASRRKFRAVRSLSANLSYMKCRSGGGALSCTADTDAVTAAMERASGMSDDNDQPPSLPQPPPPAPSEEVALPEAPLMLPGRADTSSSTETLTERPSPNPASPLPPDPPTRRSSSCTPAVASVTTPVDEIWQVRVTLGGRASDQRPPVTLERPTVTLGRSPLTFERPPVALDDRRPEQSRRVIRPIPVKLEMGRPASPCRHPLVAPALAAPLKRRSLRLVPNAAGYVSDPDVLARAAVRGSPLDEHQLDDLLSSLTVGSHAPRAGSLHQTSFSCPQSPAALPDAAPGFPGAVVTNGDTGEMSVKFVLTGLKTNQVAEGSRLTVTSGDTTAGPAMRCFSLNPSSAPYGVTSSTRTRDSEMFTTVSRTPLCESSAGGGGVPSLTERVSSVTQGSSRSTSSTSFGFTTKPSAMAAGADMDSASNRMARYKEERRRQLATQFGGEAAVAESSTPSALGSEPSYMRYSGRYKRTAAVTTTTISSSSGNGVTTDDVHRDKPASDDTTNLLPPTAMTDSAFRTNRASRLRATVNGTNGSDGSSQNLELNRNGSVRSRLPVGTSRGNRDSPSSIPKTYPPSAGTTTTVGGDAAPSSRLRDGSQPTNADVSPTYTTESESGSTASDGQTRVKDKSSKRKSNLNRMGTLDQPLVPSDSGDEVPRRSRKSSRQQSCDSAQSADGGAQSDTLKSLAIVRSAQHQITNQKVENVNDTQNNTCLLHVTGRKFSSTANSDANGGTKNRSNNVDTSDSEFERNEALRRSGRAAALRRPEIPDIFRAKVAQAPSHPSDADKGKSADAGKLEPFSITNGGRGDHQGHLQPEVSRKSAFTQPNDTSAGGAYPNNLLRIKPDRELSAFSPLRGGLEGSRSVGLASVDRQRNGRATEAIEELAQLVRETTAQVDSLTNVARNVEIGSRGGSLNGTMGGYLSRGRADTSPVMDFDPETPASTPQEEKQEGAFYSRVSVITTSQVNPDDKPDSPPASPAPEASSLPDLSDGVSGDRYLKRSGSFFYDAEGNWQLGKTEGLAGLLLPRLPTPGTSSKFVVNAEGEPDCDDGETEGVDCESAGDVERWTTPGHQPRGPWPPASMNTTAGLWRKVSLPGELSEVGAPDGLVTRFEVSPVVPLRRNSANAVTEAVGGRRLLAALPRSAFRSDDHYNEVPFHDAYKPSVIIGPETTAISSILKKKSIDESESTITTTTTTRSILRIKEEARAVDGRPPAVPHSILKRGSLDDGSSRSRSPDANPTILKKRGSSEESDHRCSSPEITSILRRRQSAPTDDGEDPIGAVETRHHPSILRRKSAPSHPEAPRGILRSPEPPHHHHSILKKQLSGVQDPPSILKKRGSSEDLDAGGAAGGVGVETLPPRPILKKRSSAEDELQLLEEQRPPRPILKTQRRRSGAGLDGEEDEPRSPLRRICASSSSPPPVGICPRLPGEEGGAVPRSPRPRLSRTSSSDDDDDDDEFLSLTSSSPETPRTRRLSAEEERLSNWKMIREQRNGSVSSQGSASVERSHRQSTPPASEAPSVTINTDGEIADDSRHDVASPTDAPPDNGSRSGNDWPRATAAASAATSSDDEGRAVLPGRSSPPPAPADDARKPATPLASTAATRLRREKWLSKRKDREPQRYRTQPLTFEELEATDRLQSEQFFHHLATVKVSVGRSEQSEANRPTSSLPTPASEIASREEPARVSPPASTPVVRKIIPRAAPAAARTPAVLALRKERRQTLPVSLDALAEAVQRRSEGGVVREDDGERSDDDDVIQKLSVAARAQLFMQKQQLALFQSSVRSPATARRFGNRRGLARSQTQPVTVEEVQEASKMSEDAAAATTGAQEKEQQQQRRSSVDEGRNGETPAVDDATGKATPDSEEEPSKLSLADRVKLFNKKMVEERLPTRRPSQEDGEGGAENGGVPRRRRLVVSTRFCTQPITSEEVEMAHRIGPGGGGLVRSQTCAAGGQGLGPAVPASRAGYGRSAEAGDDAGKGITKTKTVSCMASALESRLSAASLGKSSSSRGGAFSYLGSPSSVSKLDSAKTGIFKSERSPPPSSPRISPTRVDAATDSESDSSSSDGEEETEGITISVRGETAGQTQHQSSSSSSTSHGSSSASDNSTVRETRRIKNEAVLRRRNAGLRKIEERKSSSSELQHSQSLNFTSSSFTCKSSSSLTSSSSVLSGSLIQRNANSALRSPTQPHISMEKDPRAGGSIAERLAALKQSQQEDWKRRLARAKSDEGDADHKSSSDGTDSPGDGTGDESPSKILEKVSLLEVSQQGWKQRVVVKDASKFTVAGKMGKPTTPIAESPLMERKKRTPKPVRFQSKTANLLELSKASVHSVDGLPPKATPIVRSKSMPMPDSVTDSSDEAKSPTKVSIPRLDDDDFCSFFESVNFDQMQSQRVTVADDAFNQISSESRQLLVRKRTVQVSRNHVSTRNPLRTLAARADLQEEYTEVKTGIAEMELKRMKVEQLAKTSDLATSALAGLASTEDFKAVSLRKSASMLSSPLLPYKDNMLIQVKGRRHIQCRLVEPAVTSLNKGDNFVIVTPNEVYNWIGEFSNVIERAKAADMTLTIQSKKDLGFKGAGDVVTLDEEKQTVGRGKWRDFYQLLGGQDDICDAGLPDEDEIYEAAIIETNKVYDVIDNSLVPIEKYWGCLPRVEMLDPKKVIVFDFGGEMYVWQGKLVPNDMRRRAIRLARELWDEGYDYVECDINPIHPHQQNKMRSGKPRPPWALFAKVNQHMETVLFRSKFLDWPDMERIIKIKRQDSESKSDSSLDLQPCNAQQMLESLPDEPDLVLENSHLGRGLSYWDAEERRQSDVATLAIKVWHIQEYNHSILPLESLGQFHRGDTYVVRWQYRLTVGGRDLLGNISKHSCQGRERTAYFFWQGQDSTINEKGASALLTVELDEERGPQVRVVQGQEPPSFLNLFKGSMIVHFGKKGEEINKDKWRLFVVRGEFENEAHLVEVRCNSAALRSRGAYVLIHPTNGQVFRWCGANVSDHLKEASLAAVEILEGRRPSEIGFPIGADVVVEDVTEGSESDEFWEGLGGKRTMSADSSSENGDASPQQTPRLFHFSSVSGIFISNELACSFRSKDRASAYPFTQGELYKVTQPALFLFDNHTEVYLWQGWWPEATEDNDNLATGSAHLRWNVERRLAMETVLDYCKISRLISDKSPESAVAAHLVWAGLEPEQFRVLFPEWKTHSDVAKLNLALGIRDGETKRLQDVLLQLKRNRYTFAELQERPLPEGVDPTILESYLCKDEFEEVLKMSKKEFYALPSWKQSNLKKTAGLFY